MFLAGKNKIFEVGCRKAYYAHTDGKSRSLRHPVEGSRVRWTKDKKISTESFPRRRHRAERPEIINNQASRKFRPEIQGLRALAVLLVAAYHFWFGKVSGGVDVFLLISAFLMAGSFTRKIENKKFEGVKAVIHYWIHAFKRILPLASVTVVGILAGSYVILPKDRWLSLISEAKSVVFYYENWWSIHNLVDYYASDSSAASPFRHFWSLSLQGQIYIIWPLIFLVSAAIIKFLNLNARLSLFIVFGIVFAFSLVYSIYITNTSQTTAYFNTFARLWEFALGSLVAIILPYLNLNRYLRALMGWVGIAMIISCGFIFDVEGVFPGYHALWPTLAAAAIIIAGDTQTKFGPEKLLMLKPLVGLGGFSYGLYLIHWPLLVFYLYLIKSEKADYVSGIGLLTISLILSYILTKFVETPLRSWKALDRSNWKGLAVVLACMALVMGSASGWKAKIEYDVAEAERLAPINNPGARSLEEGFVYQGAADVEKLPAEKRDRDWASMGPLCKDTDASFSYMDTLAENCHHPVINSNPTKKVVAVGASHIQMWAPDLISYAEDQGWDLYIVSRGACHFGYPGDNGDNTSCDDYAQNAYSFTTGVNPDLVIVNSTLSVPNAPDFVQSGMEARIADFTSKNIEVVGLRDTPRFTESHLACEERTRSECTFAAAQDVEVSPSKSLESKYPGYGDVNLSDIVCPNNECPTSIGNVYTYFDTHHISATYAKSANDFFRDRMAAALAVADAATGQTVDMSGTASTQPSEDSSASAYEEYGTENTQPSEEPTAFVDTPETVESASNAFAEMP